MEIIYLVMVLFSALIFHQTVLGAVDNPEWRRCGHLELPDGLSPTPKLFNGGRLRVDGSGSLYCSCSEPEPAELDRLTIQLSNDGERVVATLSAKAYPCLSAVCAVQSVQKTLDTASFDSVDLLKTDCGNKIQLYRTANDGVEVTPTTATPFGKVDMNECKGSTVSLVLSKKVNLTGWDGGGDDGGGGEATVRWLAGLDMDSCAHSLNQRSSSSSSNTTAHLIILSSHFSSSFSSTKKQKSFSYYSSRGRARQRIRRSNNAPSFLTNYFSPEVIENSPVGTVVATAEASDIDAGINGQLTYSMEPSPHLVSGDYFQINSSSGQITTIGQIDREEYDSHSFLVTATDGSGLDATVIYSISVIDINDNSPTFTMGNSYTNDLREDHDLNEAIVTFVVADDDDGANSEISFFLVNNTDNIFSLTSPSISSSGTYSSSLILAAPLDYEALDSYHLEVVARDGGEPSHSTTASVIVTVLDVVDNPPVFTNSQYQLYVPENTSIGTTVFILNATTIDSPEISTISYNLLATSPSDYRFLVTTDSGAITVHNALDYEMESRYSLSIEAQTAPGLETDVTVHVDIVNVNDNEPQFTRTTYSGSIMEGQPPGRRIVTLQANDNDDGVFGKVAFFITGGDPAVMNNFTLNSTTGELTTQTVLDHEIQAEYIFQVIAKDGGNPSRYDQATVTIQVENRNDEVPMFLILTRNVTIAENSGSGVLVTQLQAEDADSSSLEYYLETPEYLSLFSVDMATGLVTTKTDLDREESAFYILEVSATDGQLTSPHNALIYVTVTDVNDKTPLFPISGYSASVSEELSVNETVVVVEAMDSDEPGPNSNLTYWSNNIQPYFSLSPQSGILRLIQRLDYEEEDYYSFLVWANDSGSPSLSSSAVVKVYITDENDNAPRFIDGPRSARVRENGDAFVSVLRLPATDADSGSNAELEYRIISDEATQRAFFIDQSGNVKTRESLDREEKSSYHFTVEVKDKGSVPLSSTVEVNIEVLDVIDSPPRFDSVIYAKEITTATPAHTSLLRVVATTKDNVSSSSIFYSLGTGANRTLFRINRHSGEISTAVNIDPHTHRGRYTFHVTAQHQQFSATTTVRIDIIFDGKAPRLQPLSVYVSVYGALMEPWTTLGTVTLERNHDEHVNFSLVQSSDWATNSFFAIDFSTGAISVSHAARRGHYELELEASSILGVGKGIVEVYVQTVSNSTLENGVVIEFDSGSEIYFIAVTLERFAAALTEIIPCSRDQVEIAGVQEEEEDDGRLAILVAVRERSLLGYVPREVLLDRLKANEGSSRLQNVVRFWSEECMNEPCPNFQQCSPVVHVHRFSQQRATKVLQSPKHIYISHPFSRSFTCHCPPGNNLTDLCGTEIDLCTPSPCHFGAPCRNLHGGDYQCDCPPYTGGKNCSLLCPSSSCKPCSPDPCLHESLCQESTDLTSYSCTSCPWPRGYSGPNCELTSLHFGPRGYAAFPSLNSAVKTNISFSFASISLNGLLLFVGRVSGSHDLLSISLVQGQLRVTISLGDPSELITMTTDSHRRLNDGRWHKVVVHLEGNQKRLRVTVSNCSREPAGILRGGVTNWCVLEGKVSTGRKSLDVDSMLYVGGVESHVSLPPSSSFLPHFEGCLSNLTIDDRMVDLANPIRQRDTSPGCSPLAKECSIDGSCPPGGVCVPVWNGTVCHCEDTPTCGRPSSAISVSDQGYLRLELSPESPLTIRTFSLAFKKQDRTTGTLIQFGQTTTLQLIDNSLIFTHNSSSSLPTTLILRTTISDDTLWHTVSLTTTLVTTQLSLDSGRPSAISHPTSLGYTTSDITLGSSNPEQTFNGCLSNLTINDQEIDLLSFANSSSSNSQFWNIESDGVLPGCLPGSECTNYNCPAHSYCESDWRTSICVCEDGYAPTGEGRCVNLCDPNPCQNGGRCKVEKEEEEGEEWRRVCECRVGYSGERCEVEEKDGHCQVGFFHSPTGSCRPCVCHTDGATKDVCDNSGRCLCNSSLNVFSPPVDVGCQPCDCHVIGSLRQQCLPSSGECPCRPGVTGRRCDTCMKGYAGFSSNGCNVAVVVRGLFTLTTVSYDSTLTRRGSPHLTSLTSSLAQQLKVSLEQFALFGEEEVEVASLTNSSTGHVVVNYTVSSYSPYSSHRLPDNHHHTLASVLQWMVQSEWVGPYGVDPASHFLLTGCSSCYDLSVCSVTEVTPQNPQSFDCVICPNGFSLDGVLCRKKVDQSCTGPDSDRDGIPDVCDNCLYLFNPSQSPNDCTTSTGMCPVGHSSGGVLWSSVPQYSTAVAPCPPPYLGYVKRECGGGGVWGEVDERDCLSPRGQQILTDSDAIRSGQLMNIHELIFSLTDLAEFVEEGVAVGVARDISGGDLAAVGTYIKEVALQLVERSNRSHTEDHRLLLKVVVEVLSHLLSPSITSVWNHTSTRPTLFSPSSIPSTVELVSSLFQLYQAKDGASQPNIVVQTMINVSSGNISRGVRVYVSPENGTSSSVDLPQDLGKFSNKSIDVVVAVYPSLSSLLPPFTTTSSSSPSSSTSSPFSTTSSSTSSPSSSFSSSSSTTSTPTDNETTPTNMTVASVVMTLQIWNKSVAIGNLSTPVIITLAHTRRVYVYDRERAKCVIWQDAAGSLVGWREGDCEVTRGNATHTTCSCYHLSTFAVLLPYSSFLEVEDDGSDADFHPGVFSYACLSLSAFLLLLTLLALWIIRWSNGSVYVTVYKNLVLSLLLSSIIFLVGINKTYDEVMCSGFAIVLDFLIVSSLFWLVVVGVVIARLQLHPPPKPTSWLATLFLIAGLWTVPALMCVVPVGVVAMARSSFPQDFGYPHYCMVAPHMALVLLVPMAILLTLMVLSVVMTVVFMRLQKASKWGDGGTFSSSSTATTPGSIAITQNRARRQLVILMVTLSLYLVTWALGLLAIYGHIFPGGSTRTILEIGFSISYTCLSVFLFIVLALNKKVRSVVRARFEPKYQNSSLRAVAHSSSLLTRGGGGGGSGHGLELSRTPPTGRERHHRQQRRVMEGRRVEVGTRIVGREQFGGYTSLDLASMDGHPRTPNLEPLYSQIVQSADHAPSSAGRQPRRAPATRRRDPPQRPSSSTTIHSPTHHSTPQEEVPRLQIVAPPIFSSGADADVDTDGIESGLVVVPEEEEEEEENRRPWYHVSNSEFNRVLPTSSPGPANSEPREEVGSDNDDSSRADPSGVSATSAGQSDVEEETTRQRQRRRSRSRVMGDGELAHNEELEEAVRRERWSRDSAEGSLSVHISSSRERRLSACSNCNPENPRRHSLIEPPFTDVPPTVTTEPPPRQEEEEEERDDDDDELTDLQTRFTSPQLCADPMWYRRGSSYEETSSLLRLAPALTAIEQETGQQTASAVVTTHQKSVTWADQEPNYEINPRHSYVSAHSSVSSRSIQLEHTSAPSSHEPSPCPTITPGYPGGLGTSTPTGGRIPPEGFGRVFVRIPSPSQENPQRRRSLAESPLTLSPSSSLSSDCSNSQQHVIGQTSTTIPTNTRFNLPAPRQRGLAVGQYPVVGCRLSLQDYHSNGPSAHAGVGSSAAASAARQNHHQSPHLIRHNPDGSRTVQSLV